MHFLETPDFFNLLQIGHSHHFPWDGWADGQSIFLKFFKMEYSFIFFHLISYRFKIPAH
jgi:hypothetical protein